MITGNNPPLGAVEGPPVKPWDHDKNDVTAERKEKKK